MVINETNSGFDILPYNPHGEDTVIVTPEVFEGHMKYPMNQAMKH
jgi:hypothetical protein